MINRVTLIGRLGKNPEMRYLDNGVAFARFSLATSEFFQKEDGWKEDTEWHNIVMWRDVAQRAEKNLRKGFLVFIEGKLTYRKWRDADGREREITEIVADKYRILNKTEAAPQPQTGDVLGSFFNGDLNKENAAATDDLPF